MLSVINARADMLLFKMHIKDYVALGASLQWVSAFPLEDEVLYPREHRGHARHFESFAHRRHDPPSLWPPRSDAQKRGTRAATVTAMTFLRVSRTETETLTGSAMPPPPPWLWSQLAFLDRRGPEDWEANVTVVEVQPIMQDAAC